MTYDPKIYIRDYGVAERRLLAVPPADITIAGPTLVRLAGDQQTGDVELALSGVAGRRFAGTPLRIVPSTTTLT